MLLRSLSLAKATRLLLGETVSGPCQGHTETGVQIAKLRNYCEIAVLCNSAWLRFADLYRVYVPCTVYAHTGLNRTINQQQAARQNCRAPQFRNISQFAIFHSFVFNLSHIVVNLSFFRFQPFRNAV